jgi:hypothetical protein
MKSSRKEKKNESKPATVNKVALAALTKDLLSFTSRLEKSRSKIVQTALRQTARA